MHRVNCKPAFLTRCQTGKDSTAVLSFVGAHNEASSICMADPIWSRDGDSYNRAVAGYDENVVFSLVECRSHKTAKYYSRNSKERL